MTSNFPRGIQPDNGDPVTHTHYHHQWTTITGPSVCVCVTGSLFSFLDGGPSPHHPCTPSLHTIPAHHPAHHLCPIPAPSLLHPCPIPALSLLQVRAPDGTVQYMKLDPLARTIGPVTSRHHHDTSTGLYHCPACLLVCAMYLFLPFIVIYFCLV